jgi:hypothetical protein
MLQVLLQNVEETNVVFRKKKRANAQTDRHILPIVNSLYEMGRSRGSSFGIATGYLLDGPVSIRGNAIFFSSPQCPDRLWGPPNLSSGYRGLFPRE